MEDRIDYRSARYGFAAIGFRICAARAEVRKMGRLSMIFMRISLFLDKD